MYWFDWRHVIALRHQIFSSKLPFVGECRNAFQCVVSDSTLLSICVHKYDTVAHSLGVLVAAIGLFLIEYTRVIIYY